MNVFEVLADPPMWFVGVVFFGSLSVIAWLFREALRDLKLRHLAHLLLSRIHGGR